MFTSIDPATGATGDAGPELTAAEIATREMGKTLKSARAEVEECAAAFRHYAQVLDKCTAMPHSTSCRRSSKPKPISGTPRRRA